SPDEKRLLYVAWKGPKEVLVVDGNPGPECDGILQEPLVFSPDGKRLAYGAWKGSKRVVVVDGKLGPEYDDIGKESLVFSPDGKRLAYSAKKGSKWVVVVDGESGPEYDEAIIGTSFSRTGDVLEFLAIRETMLLRVTYTLLPRHSESGGS
ncbi:MAG TPA: hypothetical protein PKX48_13715, partial [Planctomycetota bacterium]|nr:hypothetical protein [Planctomycetota bacterium]HPL61716.1 hypothetical protein [Planctomycetota bacterium]